MAPSIRRKFAVGRVVPRLCLVNNFRRLLVGPVSHDFALGPEPVERACAGLAREKWHVASDGPTPEPEGIWEDLFPEHPLVLRAQVPKTFSKVRSVKIMYGSLKEVAEGR